MLGSGADETKSNRFIFRGQKDGPAMIGVNVNEKPKSKKKAAPKVTAPPDQSFGLETERELKLQVLDALRAATAPLSVRDLSALLKRDEVAIRRAILRVYDDKLVKRKTQYEPMGESSQLIGRFIYWFEKPGKK